jgi:hypothetical protein
VNPVPTTPTDPLEKPLSPFLGLQAARNSAAAAAAVPPAAQEAPG